MAREAKRASRSLQLKRRNQELRPYIDSLPWDRWKAEYITRKNADGTWYFRSLRHFAIQQVSTKQVGADKVKISADQFVNLVEYKCGPFEVDSANAYHLTSAYHSDWNEARVGYRWGIESKKAATDLAKIDRQVYLLEKLDYPLTKYKVLIERALQMMADIEGHFQGKFLLDDSPYQSAVAPRSYRGKDPKEEKKAARLQAEYDLIQAQELAQRNRFETYCTMMDRAQKMFELACEGYRRCLQVGTPKIEMRQQVNNVEQLTTTQVPHTSNIDRIATAFLENAARTAENFEFDPPKFVTVESSRIETSIEEEASVL